MIFEIYSDVASVIHMDYAFYQCPLVNKHQLSGLTLKPCIYTSQTSYTTVRLCSDCCVSLLSLVLRLLGGHLNWTLVLNKEDRLSAWCMWAVGGGGDKAGSEMVTSHILLGLCIDTHLEQV